MERRVIVKLNDAQTKKLLEYTGSIQFKQLALNMMLTRLKGMYKANQTSVTLAKCTAEFNALFDKFARIMQSDYDQIVKL
jgi:ATP-dependent protease HslVU (ClpYQ) peptidase subunit